MRRRLLGLLLLSSALLVAACQADPVSVTEPVEGAAESPSPIESPSVGIPPTPARLAVPDLVSLRLPSARSQARASEFRLSISKKESTEAPGTVLGQRPRPGSARTKGATIRIVVAKPPPPPPPEENCQGYSPCLPPGPDVDCEGGSGDGPRYTGFVEVTGSDPYDLDGDGDGFGCE